MWKKWFKQIADQLQGRSPEVKELEPAMAIVPDPPVADEVKGAPADGETPGTLGRWMQRRQLSPQAEACLEQLAQTNEKLLAVLDRISQSSRDHDGNLEQLTQAQDKFVTLLDRQGKVLEQMLGEVQRLTATTDRLVAALEAVPKSSREQSEKLSAIEDQLQTDGQTDRALLGTMDVLGRHVASLARFAETQQNAREELAQNLGRQFAPLVDALREQGRMTRFNVIASVVIAGLILLGLGAVILTKVF